MAKTRRQSGLGSGKRQRSQLPAGVLWLASYLARRAPLTSLESHQMPSICGLDPDWQETCDHRQGVFSALEVGSVRRTQHPSGSSSHLRGPRYDAVSASFLP